ncbi:MAG: valine--tRNA ligase [Gemmatimonadales bacterium]|nr:MAG: valine--tRNA ligase [Gemmatimonadales bacterium]
MRSGTAPGRAGEGEDDLRPRASPAPCLTGLPRRRGPPLPAPLQIDEVSGPGYPFWPLLTGRKPPGPPGLPSCREPGSVPSACILRKTPVSDSAAPLPPRLDPGAIEAPLYRRALEEERFHSTASRVLEEGADPYVIVIPPPNVTAVLHMGHGLNNTVQDVLVRWRRMQGRAAVWVPGTDHAGIATQNVVERKLAAEEGKTRFDVGRDEFVGRVWDFVGETGGSILEQLKAIGSSCDWDRTRFTLDPELSRAVREVFVRLYEKDLIYRGEYIINWCPRCGTALSNEEAEAEERPGRLHHLRYLLSPEASEAARDARDAGAPALEEREDGRWTLTVSTTRPETMLGDTGVAVHPDDERYRALVGHQVQLPLAGRTIPIVADAFVDQEFGTGMVKVTPAHDPNDFEIARRTGLEVLDILTPEARVNDRAPEAFRGLDRFDARSAVLEALEAEGLVRGVEDHAHSVPHCYRCDTVVEPRLSDQWFVRMEPLARPALEASRNGTVRFHPDRWTKVYEDWLENIRDWCISRQLWWGHRIPVWYCRGEEGCGETICARETPEACPTCGSAELEQDPDVLDTWFSSWLWPFSVFGWPEETDDLKAFYPGHALVTAPEILFFWVSRMIMAGYEFQGEAPFTDVFLHGTVRDAQGRKMSKSLGNGIDPMEVVERYGADALRYTVLSMCGVGTDIHLDHEDLDAAFAPGRNFANKLWNAGRFTLMSIGDDPVLPLAEVEADLEVADRWILSRLAGTSAGMTRELERFRIHDVVEQAHHLFRSEFADWYLEVIKPRLRGEEGEASRQAARAVLVHALDGILRLLHPLVPFVTEHLWDRIPWPRDTPRPERLPVAAWPGSGGGPSRLDPKAEADFRAFRDLVTTVRSLRKTYGVGEGAPVRLVLRGAPADFRAAVDAARVHLEGFARIEDVTHEEAGRAAAPGGVAGASAVLGNGTEVFLPLEGLIDLDRERERLRAEVERLDGQLKGSEKRLANEQFTARAPAEIVEREREKVLSFRDQRDKLQVQLQALGSGDE